MADERLTEAAADLRAELARVPIPDPPTSRRTRLGWLLVPAAVAAVIVILVLPGGVADPETVGTSLPTGGETSLPPPTVTTTPPTTSSTTVPRPTTTSSLAVNLPAAGPIFGETTGVALLLDDGLEGLTAIDPDRRLVDRSPVEGQRRGDEPYSMIRVGDKLVVGWGEPHAVDIETRQAISLGRATIFVPAAEPNRVWLIDYPGGPIGSGTPTVWQVDVSTGEALNDPVPLPVAGYPTIGIQGGLALQTDTGLTLWNVSTGELTALESDGTGAHLPEQVTHLPGPGFPHDVFGEELIWCSGECTRLAVTNTSTLITQTYDPLPPFDTFLIASQISPDGRYLAALIGFEGYRGTAIWVLNRGTGVATDIFDPETHVDFLAWSPDGEQLFATSYSYGATRTTVWRYHVADQTLTTVVLPFGGAISPVVIDASMADAYFVDQVADF